VNDRIRAVRISQGVEQRERSLEAEFVDAGGAREEKAERVLELLRRYADASPHAAAAGRPDM
jgi:hypothetical protein